MLSPLVGGHPCSSEPPAPVTAVLLCSPGRPRAGSLPTTRTSLWGGPLDYLGAEACHVQWVRGRRPPSHTPLPAVSNARHPRAGLNARLRSQAPGVGVCPDLRILTWTLSLTAMGHWGSISSRVGGFSSSAPGSEGGWWVEVEGMSRAKNQGKIEQLPSFAQQPPHPTPTPPPSRLQ